MPQPSYPLGLADWCLPFDKNLPKEITTHFINLPVKRYDEIPEFLYSVPDLLNKLNDAFTAYTTSFKLISEQVIMPIGVCNYCQELSKFVKGPNRKNTFLENVEKAQRYLQKEGFAGRVEGNVLEVFEGVRENVTELDVVNEYLVNSMIDASDVFGKIYRLLDEGELDSLYERLILEDEEKFISEKTHEYLAFFDDIVPAQLKEDKAVYSYLVNESNNETIEENNEVEKIVHQLGSVPEKYHYLSNFFPIPANYEQPKMLDLFIVKNISNHFDIIIKMNGVMNKTPERIWTAHVLAYIFFITFCFIDSSQYFSCERDISTKIDIQDNGYKADGQIPLFLLEVSEGLNNPDPDKINDDRHKLLSEGVFSLNKFMLSTELPKWKVCETLRIFLAQAFADKIEIGQLIFIGLGLYLFALFTIPVLTIPTSNTDLNHIKRFIEFRKEGQENITKSKPKYATGFTPEWRNAVTFAKFLPKILREGKNVNGRGEVTVGVVPY
ncbi:10635_t:CDS:2 [Funneliformis mosseae]|uniref:10635_t:CDS:1 n=1 Tax=Funneliformis mosseae TaxID=27381 RepID=A0A9N9ATF2_FUNMO|nr:10635_t:CDS:2 [Funneliformis mosseae]